MNYSSSLIGMIETGRRVPSRDLAERLDEVFGPDRGTFARLETGLRGLPYPASFRPFSAYEAGARSLRLFEHVLAPGLLQTADYARAVYSSTSNAPIIVTSDNQQNVMAVLVGTNPRRPADILEPVEVGGNRLLGTP